MTVRRELDYFGLFNGKPSGVKPNPDKSIVLINTKPTKHRINGIYRKITVIDDGTVFLSEGPTYISIEKGERKIVSTPFDRTLREDQITAANLETKRNWLGIKTIYSYKP